ncbi:hypothetical protein GGE45_003918 [Rhizobium aethiopicum]|uniref:hypothetical protein n=1 Tax=Rhizobium aethiopicum TaxID=1138170 RepID=UPI0016178413|nr:hypothetical protein [Rhizobium aethiopicum]MBB4581570.1 hypothetical protein [Rhizobium aethiopicum]
MNDTTEATEEAALLAGGTAPHPAGKLHILGRRNDPSRPETADAAIEALSEGGEVPFEEDEALVEEALAAEEAEAEASLDEEQ